jgi:hypothetical protein
MRAIRSSGSVGEPAGNRRLYPEAYKPRITRAISRAV